MLSHRSPATHAAYRVVADSTNSTNVVKRMKFWLNNSKPRGTAFCLDYIFIILLYGSFNTGIPIKSSVQFFRQVYGWVDKRSSGMDPNVADQRYPEANVQIEKPMDGQMQMEVGLLISAFP